MRAGLPVTLLACQGRQSLSAPLWRLHSCTETLGLNKSTNGGEGGKGGEPSRAWILRM